MEMTARAACAPHIYDLIVTFARSAADKADSLISILLRAFSREDAVTSDTRTQSREDINAAAERLLDTYGDSILRLAYSYLHSMDDAEDVVQDTLTQYLREHPVFNIDNHEKAWCLRVAANLAKNRIKYNRLREFDELNEELVAEGREDLSFVWEAVSGLPQKYREVIHLFYHEDMTTADIAAVLGRSEATVRSQLARGRERLGSVLKEAYDFEG